MTEIHDRPVLCRDELQLLLEDLACVCGTLSEIMTAWRRVQPGRPELRAGRLVRLQDDTRQLAADLKAAGDEGWALCAGGRLTALAEEAAAIRAVTSGPGHAEAGDQGLWERLAAAVRRAQARPPALAPAPVTVPRLASAGFDALFTERGRYPPRHHCQPRRVRRIGTPPPPRPNSSTPSWRPTR
jgi:hypothetical protein